MAPEPKVEREKELGHVEVREREDPEVREFEPPKAKTNPKDINAEDFLPSGVTPQKALQMLKDMIQKRSGRWLVTPVLEEDGCLVTSDKAFDMIAYGKHRHQQTHPLRDAEPGTETPFAQETSGKIVFRGK
ncbi:hypothetical protein WI664_08000 [Vibrio cholerae]